MARYTITFSDRGELGEKAGWTAFWDYHPELTLACGNRFYSFKDGQLWEHNDNENPQRGVFYNQSVIAKITTILNELNAEDKIFKTMVLESNDAWKTEIKTNYTESVINESEFNKRESKYYAHIRKNENQSDITDRVQGIGVISMAVGNQITFSNKIPTLVNVGENLVQMNGQAQENLGVISNITGNTITLTSVLTPVLLGAFCFSLKNARVQGSEIRGYFAEVTLSNNNRERVELFAINSNIVVSHTTTTQQE